MNSTRFFAPNFFGVLLLCAWCTSAFAILWEDTWSRPYADIRGICLPTKEASKNVIKFDCPGDDLNPDGGYRTFAPSLACTNIPSPCVATDQEKKILYFHGEDLWDNGKDLNTGKVSGDGKGQGEGFPMISGKKFNKDGYISAEVVAKAYCSRRDESGQVLIDSSAGCFFGLAIYNGESNYREIAYQGTGGGDIKVRRFAGGAQCSTELGMSVAPGVPHKLRIDYYGHEGGKWIYFVDDIVKYIEYANDLTPAPCRNIENFKENGVYTVTEEDFKKLPEFGRVLENNPRVGLFFVGGTVKTVDSFRSYVEGDIGPLRVWSNLSEENVGASQNVRVDGLAATNVKIYAQEIFMTPPMQNISRVKLFLVNGKKYIISAHLDNMGVPGTLINQVVYEPDAYGVQDVPLWVPRRWESVWLVIKSISPEAADFGTSAPNTNPYSGRLLFSNDAGSTWHDADRDAYFITYERR